MVNGVVKVRERSVHATGERERERERKYTLTTVENNNSQDLIKGKCLFHRRHFHLGNKGLKVVSTPHIIWSVIFEILVSDWSI